MLKSRLQFENKPTGVRMELERREGESTQPLAECECNELVTSVTFLPYFVTCLTVWFVLFVYCIDKFVYILLTVSTLILSYFKTRMFFTISTGTRRRYP